MPETPALEVVNLTKNYGNLLAVDSLSFTVERGRTLGLVGPNGAGKTTTLRAIAGIHPATDGSVRICGTDIRLDPVGAKRHLAFMPDEPRLFDYLTVEEHLQFSARLYQATNYRSRLDELLAEFELLDKRKAMPTELSRGMKQKLMIACGFIHQPDVLIFDEPLTGLDPLGIRHMKETIVARGRAGSAVLVSSHLLHLVEEICSRVIIIDRGRKIADGTMAELSAKAEAAGSTLEDIFLKVTGRETEKPLA